MALAQEKPHVVIVATGGTIAGEQRGADGKSYKAGSLSVDNLLAAVPGLNEIARIDGEQFSNIGSQDMNDEVWLQLSKRLSAITGADDVNGVVVTHGTDTLEETAYFMELTVDTDKPVVFTGSMRPATAVAADGPGNLYAAVAVAADPAAVRRGALTVLNDTILSARSVYKVHSSRVDAFGAPDQGPVGTVHTGHVTFNGEHRRGLHGAFSVAQVEKLPDVAIIYAHANLGRGLIDAAVAAGARGIVLAGVGNGNLTAPALQALADVAAKGVIVVRSTRVAAGPTLRNAEVDDDRYGFVAAGDLKPSKARVLLQLALLENSDAKRTQCLFDIEANTAAQGQCN